MRAFLLEKGYTEKEIELIKNKESLENILDCEIGRYHITSINGFDGPDYVERGSVVILDTKTGDIVAVHRPNSKENISIRKINISSKFKQTTSSFDNYLLWKFSKKKSF